MGGFAFMFSHLVPQSIVLMGVLCGACSLVVMLLYMKIRGIQFFDRSGLTEEDKELEKEIPLWKALLPWGLLIFFCVITNFVGPLKDILYSGPLEMPRHPVAWRCRPADARDLERLLLGAHLDHHLRHLAQAA